MRKTALNQIIRNVGLLVSGQGAVSLLAFLALTINARALEAEDLGKLFLVQATCEMIAKGIGLQTWQAVVKLAAREAQTKINVMGLWVFGIVLDTLGGFAAALLAVFILTMAPGLVGLEPEVAKYGVFYAFSLVLSSTGASVGVLRFYNRFGQVVAIDVLRALALCIAAGFLFYLSATLEAYLIAIPLILVLTSLLLTACGLVCALKHHGGVRDFSLSRDYRRAFLSFALGLSASGSLKAVRQRGEVIMVGTVAGSEAAAFFGVAYRLAQLLRRFGEAARIAVYPELSKLIADKKFFEAKAVGYELMRWSGIFGVVILFATIFWGDAVLVLLFGVEFEQASLSLAFLTLASCLYFATFAIGPLVEIAFGSWRVFAINLVAFAGFITVGFSSLYVFGSAGAGVGSVAFTSINALLMMQQIRRTPPIEKV